MLSYRKKILVAVDGSAVADKAAYEAVWMASCSKGAFPNKVYAVFVKVPQSRDYLDMFPPGANPAAVDKQEHWDEVIDQVFLVIRKLARENEVPLETRVTSGDPAKAILKLARELDVDVIVIGSTGKGRMIRTFLGSVSAEIINEAPCCVYLVRA
jgi:nucleotide-binding universal stress UspA family protein